MKKASNLYFSLEQLKLFFQPLASRRLQTVAQQLGQFCVLLLGQIQPLLQQEPMCFFQSRIVVVFCHCSHLLGESLIDYFVILGYNTVSVQCEDGMVCFLGDDAHSRFPQVIVNEARQRVNCSLLADPQQMSAVLGDLVD